MKNETILFFFNFQYSFVYFHLPKIQYIEKSFRKTPGPRRGIKILKIGINLTQNPAQL